MPLKPGDKAPTFALLDQSGSKGKRSDFKGRKVLSCTPPRRRGAESQLARARFVLGGLAAQMLAIV